jgi:excisionase family DNA binding protein
MATDLHSVAQVAAVLGASVRHAYNLVAEGALPVVDIGRGGRPKLRIRDDHLQAYIDSRTHTAPQPAHRLNREGGPRTC